MWGAAGVNNGRSLGEGKEREKRGRKEEKERKEKKKVNKLKLDVLYKS